MRPSRVSIWVAQFRMNYELPIKMALGGLALVALVKGLHSLGFKPDSKTYGRGPGWTCARDDALTSDPPCWRTKPPEKSKGK
jgi:hypothetical protein